MDEGMQTGCSAAGAATGEASAASAESTSNVSGAETNSTDGSAAGKESGLPPTASQPAADNNIVAASEKGSFELRYNERTGRNEVVSTMPAETEGQGQQSEELEQQPQAQQQTQQQPQNVQQNNNSYAGNELLNFLNNPQAAVQQMHQAQNQPAPEYTLQELQTAIQSGQIDEARIPVALRAGYYAAMQQAQQQVAPQPQEMPQPVDETEKAKAFYGKVQSLAQERAMKEVGITQDDIDLAEYTDDQTILDKFNAYKVAVENNRSRILQDVNNIQREQQMMAADRGRAYDAISAFVSDMRQKEPNFDAIDKLMISRVNKMPYEQAVRIAPLIEKVQNGTLTTADLPALQEMYNQTRLEFYSNKTGVSLAPKPTKPAYVETPGNGASAPKKTTPLSALGKMSKRDREAAIGQMFGNFFDED